MKAQIIAAVAALSSTVSAIGPFGGWPSCANDCFSKNYNGQDYKTLCTDSGKVDSLTSCVGSSSCAQGDKDSVYSYIRSVCGTSGVTITSGVYASATTGWGPSWTTYPSSLSSAWNSFTSAHPTPNSAEWSSFTSQYGGSWPTNGPWGGNWGGFGGFGGWGVGGGGWKGGAGGPFGGGNWGPWGQSGAWTAGPWTSWWDGKQCPASDWPGWTSGSWSTNAPWTSWTACTASTTAASVYTTTISGVATTATSYGFQVAQAVQTGTSGNAASNGKTVAAGAAAAAFIGAIAAL